MITFAETVIKQEDLILFRKIKRALDCIETFDTPGFDELTCHILGTAIGSLYGIKTVHGYWKSGYEHTWCVTDNGNIIDPYPIGAVGGPILITREVCYNLYNEREIRHGDTSSEKFLICVATVKEQIQRSERRATA